VIFTSFLLQRALLYKQRRGFRQFQELGELVVLGRKPQGEDGRIEGAQVANLFLAKELRRGTEPQVLVLQNVVVALAENRGVN
jgi:hypothetical protein